LPSLIMIVAMAAVIIFFTTADTASEAAVSIAFVEPPCNSVSLHVEGLL
jgi:hypothetical protein